VPNTNALYLDELIHPRVEAEIAFRIAESIKGPGVTETQVMAAVDGIMPAIEVVDSRFENFDFDLPSVVADNASSSRFVTGDKLDEFERLDLSTLGVVLEINGEIVDTGAGAAVLGHPARSVALLANMLADSGQHIPAGSIVLTGGITAAHAIGRGDQVMARVHELGTVSFQVK